MNKNEWVLFIETVDSFIPNGSGEKYPENISIETWKKHQKDSFTELYKACKNQNISTHNTEAIIEMFIVTGNGHYKTSSNPGQGWTFPFALMPLRR